MENENVIFGVMAEFETHTQLLVAARAAFAAGYRKMDAYSPFPVEGLAEAIGVRRTGVPLICLIGGLAGGIGGYFMQWFAQAVHYPLNVGGRPFHSAPSYIPVTFELTVLCAALCTVIGMLALNGLPRPNHPIFNADRFARATTDRFFLC